MYACLAVTCHLHVWQNDRDFLRATVVTRGWNGYRNKSQHRKSTLEKKVLPPFQQGFEPATFQSRVRCSNQGSDWFGDVFVCFQPCRWLITPAISPVVAWSNLSRNSVSLGASWGFLAPLEISLIDWWSLIQRYSPLSWADSLPHETAAVSAQVLCTPYNHAPCHIMQSHIRKVYVCLAVTCHLHFWQNDRDLLRATAVTRGWNGYRNKSQHRKSTLENKILPPLLRGFEPTTFQSRVRRSNHWAIPAPCIETFAGTFGGFLAPLETSCIETSAVNT